MKGSFPFLLCVLDGWADNPNPRANAVAAAKTPTMDRLLLKYPHTQLLTSGAAVGLPGQQMGNSEVGHLNIGAGRIVQQDLTRLDIVAAENRFGEIPELQATLSAAKNGNGAVHFIGLVSKGGVHSSLQHLQSLVEVALRYGNRTIFIHVITDGRDRPQTAAEEEVAELESFIAAQRSKFPDATLGVSTIIGRYFAMDRDKRWDRTKKAYDLFTMGVGKKFVDSSTAIKSRHTIGQTDEFLEPIVCDLKSTRPAFVMSGDALVFFNFRADRMRQIVPALIGTPESFSCFERAAVPKLSAVATLTEYDANFNVQVLFRPPVIKNHLGQVLAKAGLRQLRIAETEKYAHVTYFFNGGDEDACEGEERIMIPSPRDVATYDLKPEMSANGVADALIAKLNSGQTDVAILNFANCDMVGHTGVFEAAVKAVETVDSCLGRILDALSALGGSALVTADHGNADQMLDYFTGEPHTFHTTYPVPCVIVGPNVKNLKLRSDGALCNIAPTICELLGLEKPLEMTASSLILP